MSLVLNVKIELPRGCAQDGDRAQDRMWTLCSISEWGRHWGARGWWGAHAQDEAAGWHAGGPAALPETHTSPAGGPHCPAWQPRGQAVALWGLGAALLSAPHHLPRASVKAGLFPESSLVFTVARPHVETSRRAGRAGCREPVGAGVGGSGLRSASLRNAGLQPTPITTPKATGTSCPATGETSRVRSGLERAQPPRGRGQGWFVAYAAADGR